MHGGAPGPAWAEMGSSAPRERVEALGGTQAVEMAPGDVFVIETPGGGGFGRLE